MPGEVTRDEVGQLDPGVGRGEDLRGGPLAVEDLGPEPLGAVGAAALRQVRGLRIAGLLGDLRRLGMAGVVLPEPCVGGKILLELGLQGQRHPVAIHRNGGRAGGVHPDPDDLLRPESAALLGRPQGPLDRFEEALDVVGRVLPGKVWVLGVQEDALLAAGVVVHVRGDLRPVAHVDHQGPDAVGSVIHADRKLPGSGLRHRFSAPAGLVCRHSKRGQVQFVRSTLRAVPANWTCPLPAGGHALDYRKPAVGKGPAGVTLACRQCRCGARAKCPCRPVGAPGTSELRLAGVQVRYGLGLPPAQSGATGTPCERSGCGGRWPASPCTARPGCCCEGA